jgi:hypothetical protein
MRKVFASVPLILILNLAVMTAAEVKPYKLSQACIEYKVTGQMFNGSEVLYFDNFGSREAKYTTHEIDMLGMKQSNKGVVYREGSTIYTVDLNTNTGTKMENDIMMSLEGKDAQQAVEDMMAKMGGKKVGTGEVLDKTCEIWDIASMGSKIWVWNGVALKTETNMAGMQMSILAIKITESFDKAKLQRPLNIQYSDAGSTGDMMKKLKSMQLPPKN